MYLMESKKLKKRKGDIVSDFSIPLVTLVIVGLLLTVFLESVKQNKLLDDLDRIGRQYMLRMETYGYLKDNDKVELIEKLNDIGVKNISLVGTNFSSASYGSDIQLHISCDVEVENVKMNGFKLVKNKEIVRYSDSWSSTAKN